MQHALASAPRWYRIREEFIVSDDMRDDRPDESRKPYAPPQIQEVPLRPEEAVLGACKTASTSGPAQAKCATPTHCAALLS